MVKKGDFVKIEYTGYDQNGNVFDSTSGETAKKLHGKEGSLLIVYGYDFIVGGIQEALEMMKKGEEKELTVPSDKAFGSRTKNRIKVFPIEEFYRNELNPYPGAMIQMETEMGTLNGLVKSVNSGRVLVDFNHPLADQEIKYKLKLVDIIESAEGKVNSLMHDLQIEGTSSISGGKAIITMKKGQPEEEVRKTRLTIAVKSTIPEIKDIEIKAE